MASCSSNIGDADGIALGEGGLGGDVTGLNDCDGGCGGGLRVNAGLRGTGRTILTLRFGDEHRLIPLRNSLSEGISLSVKLLMVMN